MQYHFLRYLSYPSNYCLDNFPIMCRPLDLVTISLSLEEVAEHAGIKVLMEVDDNGALIVGESHGILNQQLLPHPIDVFKINMIILILIKLHY
jgi:hypothetical protein